MLWLTQEFLIQNNQVKMELQIIQKKIFEIRGQKVMLDFDLAELYEVETRALNQAVKRNIDIFPDDFMFQLSKKEWENEKRLGGCLFVSRFHWLHHR